MARLRASDKLPQFSSTNAEIAHKTFYTNSNLDEIMPSPPNVQKKIEDDLQTTNLKLALTETNLNKDDIQKIISFNKKNKGHKHNIDEEMFEIAEKPNKKTQKGITLIGSTFLDKPQSSYPDFTTCSCIAEDSDTSSSTSNSHKSDKINSSGAKYFCYKLSYTLRKKIANLPNFRLYQPHTILM